MAKSIRKVRHSWAALKEQFIQRRLSGESLSLADFAAEKGVDRRSVERHSAREHWIRELDVRTRERLDAVVEQQARIINTLYPQYHLNELRAKFLFYG